MLHLLFYFMFLFTRSRIFLSCLLQLTQRRCTLRMSGFIEEFSLNTKKNYHERLNQIEIIMLYCKIYIRYLIC